ncbi:MAG: CpsD/CapB family tyrosine-protein kinase [Sulfuricaulis sp.]|uniref:tyrosine-protein kinase family protein n=1 Tax=Sulfuricaulis sp. TaxID=2003553 RepID=UPI0025D02D09|nr:CpsD/CapB family tyrosine-protein kinase [Sulfuricaulis sp.]MCR4346516.1 CpsD/CapB family tyrosine-protein kinase [Sulfuricaulis sp.]
MSKIEKALNKARTTGSLRIVSPQPQPVSREKVSDDASTASHVTALIEQRASSSEAIARMEEKAPLSKQALSHNRVIYPELGDNATVRAFREIRTKIIQKAQGRNCVIMVTSVSSGGGSSFVSLNLGVAFAFDAGKTSLLVDCNLKNPSLHRLFGQGSFRGLTDYMENSEMDIADIIHPVGIERLRVIPSGGKREIPAEYFTSLKMKQLLENIRQRYRERYVLIDAPPMTESADTQILAELCDFVVLVVPYGRVTDAQINTCIKAIDDKKLVGVVFNDEPALPDFRWLDMLKNPFAAIREVISRPVNHRNKKVK